MESHCIPSRAYLCHLHDPMRPINELRSSSIRTPWNVRFHSYLGMRVLERQPGYNVMRGIRFTDRWYPSGQPGLATACAKRALSMRAHASYPLGDACCVTNAHAMSHPMRCVRTPFLVRARRSFALRHTNSYRRVRVHCVYVANMGKTSATG